MAYQYPLNGGRINASIGGNSTSAGAGYSVVSTGTLLLAGGNNITLSQNGQSVSIVGGGGAGLSAGTQSVNTGTVNFANSNNITFGMSGSSQITASFSQSVQTVGGYASGNTTGQSSSSTFDARSVSVSAAGGISAGFSGSALQLSAPAQSSISGTGIISISRNASTISIGAPAFSVGMSTIGNTSGTTGTVSNQLILAGGNNVTLSQSTGAGGNTLTISAANQTNQSLGFYASGNTTGQSSSSTFDARTVSVSAVGGISAGFSGSALQLSAPAQSSLSATGIFSISANGSTISMGAPAYSAGISTNGNTSGTTGFATNQLLLVGGNNITLSQSTGAGGNTLTVSAASQTNQSLGLYAVSNTTQSTSGTVDARTLSFQGAGNVSVGVSNGSVIVSGGGGAGGGIALANSQATYTSGTVNLLEGGGAVTIASSAGGQSFKISVPTVSSLSATGAVSISNNGGTISIGAPTQTNQTIGLYGLGNTTQNSSTTLDARSLSFNGLGAASVGYSNGSIQLSVPTQTNQTANFYVSSNSTQLSSTAGVDLRSVTFQGAGGASFGLSQGKVLVSVNSTYAASNHSHGNPTLALTNISGTTASASNGLTLSLSANGPDGIVAMSAGTQSVSTGTMNFANSNGISFGMSASNQITASHNGITVQTNQSLGLYGVGNTTGQSSSSTFDARTLSFQGAGAASVGYSNGSVVISAPNAAAGNVTFSAGGNSAGLASVVFSNSNGVSFGLNGSTITASAVGGAGGGIALANSQTTYTSGTANLNVAGGAMTIASTTGQSFNFSVPATSSLSVTGALSLSTNGSTVSIGAPASSSIVGTGALSVSTNGSTISLGVPGLMSNWMHNSAAMYSSSTSGITNSSVSVVRMMIPQHISFTRIDIPVTVSGGTSATANTAAWAISSVGVIYSRNGSTLNPIVGQSSNTTYSYNSSNTSGFNGPRMVSFGLATTLSAGEYYLGLHISSATSSIGTATTAPGLTFAPVFGSSYTGAAWQSFGAASNASINPYQPLQGVNSVTISNTSQTMQQSQITQSGTAGARANLVVLFRNN